MIKNNCWFDRTQTDFCGLCWGAILNNKCLNCGFVYKCPCTDCQEIWKQYGDEEFLILENTEIMKREGV